MTADLAELERAIADGDKFAAAEIAHRRGHHRPRFAVTILPEA